MPTISQDLRHRSSQFSLGSFGTPGMERLAHRLATAASTRPSRCFLLTRALVGLLLGTVVLVARAGAACDVDADGDIDRDDLGLIQRAILTRAAVSGRADPRDADGNGAINSIDGRLCVLRCTRPGCATTNSPPSVSLTGPAAGASYLAPAAITLVAIPADADGTIAKVEFFHGTTLIGTATAAPYTVTWNGVPAGSYSLTAIATDNQGAATRSDPRVVTVNATNAPPTVSLTAPADGSAYTLPVTVTLSATASGIEHNTPVTRVDFYHGSTLIGGSTAAPHATTWTPTTAGTYSLTAIATDSAGGVTNSAARTVTVQGANQLPNVSLTSPVANQSFTAPANIALAAMASDADGNIARVEFFQGSALIGSATAAPYGAAWNNVPAGSYILTAKATDDLGATRSSTAIPITVTGGGPSILYLHGDHLGTPRVATNEANVVVWRNPPTTEPFGMAQPEEDPDADGQATVVNLRFPGQYFDRETLLHYNYFRDYDPQTGRYIQSDPIGLNGGVNLYGYVAGNSVSYVDPMGLEAGVTIWQPVGWGASSFGHVSVNINGTTFSYGPNGMTTLSTTTYLERNSFRDGMEVKLNLEPRQEKALQLCLSMPQDDYDSINNNCGSPIQRCLNALNIDTGSQTLPVSLGKKLLELDVANGTTWYPASRPSEGWSAPWAR